MNEAGRQKRNEAAREYRRKNPDKIQMYNIRYWEKKAEKENTPEFIANKLHEAGYTQREIAEEIGISLGQVNQLLRS